MGLKLLNVPQIRIELGPGTGLRSWGISGSICRNLVSAEKLSRGGLGGKQWKEGDLGRKYLLSGARFITLS